MRTPVTPCAYSLAVFLGSVLLSASGCDDEETATEINDPRFAMSILVTSADLSENSSLVIFADSLDSGELNLDDAIEIGGQGEMFGVHGSGEFYVTSAERLTVTKFELTEGEVREVGRVGLNGVGVAQLFGEQMIFDGPDRGFLFDLISGQAIELDLEAMEVTETVDLTSLLDPEQPTFLSFDQIVRGDEVIFSTYGSSLEQETVSDLSQIVFFDTQTGSFDLLTAPCGGLSYIMEAANGDIFFSTDPWTAGIHLLDESRAPEPCMVRMPAGAREPDSEVVRLNDVTGRPTGGLVPSGDASMYLRVLDTDTFPPTADTTGLLLFGLRGWATWELDIGNLESARPIERENLAAGGITFLDVDGTIYENDSEENFSSTRLIRTTGPGSPTAAAQTPGVPFRVVRLR